MNDSIEQLYIDDLKRSGLTPSDVPDFKVLDPAGIKTVLLSDSNITARGGYSIPYFDAYGDPVMDNGRQFVRVRTLGPLDKKTDRYRSSGMSSSFFYIPAIFWDAVKKLGSKKYLIITEGEKKAIASCLNGYPTIAIAGIQMWYDKEKDKGQNIHDHYITAIETLLNRMGPETTILVIFDSNGMAIGDKRKIKGALNDRFSERINGQKGPWVQNKKVYFECINFANALRNQLPGVPVSHTHIPVYMPEKGEATNQGIDDLLVREGPDALQPIIDRAMGNARAADPIASKETEALDDETIMAKTDGYQALGVTEGGTTCALWSFTQKSVVELSSSKLTQLGAITAVTGANFARRKWPKVNSEGEAVDGIDAQAAAIEIGDACGNIGQFNANRLKGYGVWAEGKHLVINSEDGCMDGTGVMVPRISFARKAIFSASGIERPPGFVNADTNDLVEVTKNLASTLNNWNMEMIDRMLLVGWLACSTYCGALKERPHLWLIAERGAGKSTLMRLLGGRDGFLGGYALLVNDGKNSSEPGIRQRIRRSAIPVMIDETERSGTSTDTGRADDNVGKILTAMRAAYSANDGEGALKGTKDQNGASFSLAATFLAASISDPNLEPADATRTLRINMGVNETKDVLDVEDLPAFSKENGQKFFWGLMNRWPVFNQELTRAKKAAKKCYPTADARAVTTMGTLLAGAITAFGGVTEENLMVILDQMKAHFLIQKEESSDQLSCVEAMSDCIIEIEREDDMGRIIREHKKIAQAIEEFVAGTGDFAARASLNKFNIDVIPSKTNKLDQWDVFIPSSNALLAEKMSKTRWKRDGSWTVFLRRLDGADSDRIRIGPTNRRGVRVPVRYFVEYGILRMPTVKELDRLKSMDEEAA